LAVIDGKKNKNQNDIIRESVLWNYRLTATREIWEENPRWVTRLKLDMDEPRAFV
jgi:hypothetical protein